MPFISPDRSAVCNVLLTCCKDGVCRLWAETLLPGDSHLSGYHSNLTASQYGDTVKCAASCKKKPCNGKMNVNPGQEVSCNKNVFAFADTTHAVDIYSEFSIVIKFTACLTSVEKHE